MAVTAGVKRRLAYPETFCGKASLNQDIPLHVTRFFPRWKMDGKPAADAGKVYALAQAARKHLRHVWVGNC